MQPFGQNVIKEQVYISGNGDVSAKVTSFDNFL